MKLYTAFLLLLVALTAPVLQLSAQSFTTIADPSAFKTKLKEYSAHTNSIKSDFVQEKHLSIFEDKVSSSGEFHYKKENKIRWEILSPSPYLVIINGTQMTVRDKSKTKTYDTQSNKMFSQINEVMVASIKGTIADDTKKYRAEYLASSGQYQMKLFPLEKNMKAFLSEIAITFDKKSMDVTEIRMTEPSGDYTLIRFSNKVINGTIDENVFRP